MKRIISVLIVIIFLFFFVSCEKKQTTDQNKEDTDVTTADNTSSGKTISMGYFSLAPHTFQEDNSDEPRGAGIKLFEAVAAKMGYQVKWVGPLPLPRLTEYLKSGTDLVGTVGFPKFPVFEEFMYYTDTPVYYAQATLGVKKDRPLTKISSIDDIRGFSIGVFKTASNKYTPLIDDNRDSIQLEELSGDDWMASNLKKLDLGRLDALYDRQPYTMSYEAAKLGITNFKTIDFPTPAAPMYVTFSKAAGDGEILKDAYNKAVQQVKVDYLALLQDELNLVTSK